MELLEGETLEQRLRRTGRLILAFTSCVLTQVVRALSLAHTSGVVHRGLKPSNLFLVANGDDSLVKVRFIGARGDLGR